MLALVAAFLLVSCNQGPVDYDKFEQRTIEANLTTIDSASIIYEAQLAAGSIDSACTQAQAFLLTQEGVDTACIAPDSTVWAFFTSGLLAGTGDIGADSTESGIPAASSEPVVRATGGGEVGDFTHFVLPHNVELPLTQKAVDAVRGIFQRKLSWENDETYKGSEVDLGLVLGLINPGTSVLYWDGHGTTVPLDASDPEGISVSGLILGKTYSKKQLAEAAVKQYAGYLNPAPGQDRQAAVLQFVGHKDFSVVVLPAFIRANADFDKNESQPINQTKTIVHLCCCYSAYTRSPFAEPRLIAAFLDRGADMVCGWTWTVHSSFAVDKSTTYYRAMADTCLLAEAFAELGNTIDPTPGRDGIQASFEIYGDSLVMLRAVCRVKRGDDTLQAPLVQAMRGGTGSGISALLYVKGSSDPAANVMISFPGDQPGMFNCTADENATIYWTDAGTGYTYTVMKNYVGVNGTISVDRCRPDAITGHFSGKLGWWDFGKDPEKEPPTDTIALRDGVFKFTGKVGSGKLSPQRFAAGSPPSVR